MLDQTGLWLAFALRIASVAALALFLFFLWRTIRRDPPDDSPLP